MGKGFFFLLVLLGFLLVWRGTNASRKNLFLFALSVANSHVTTDNTALNWPIICDKKPNLVAVCHLYMAIWLLVGSGHKPARGWLSRHMLDSITW